MIIVAQNTATTWCHHQFHVLPSACLLITTFPKSICSLIFASLGGQQDLHSPTGTKTYLSVHERGTPKYSIEESTVRGLYRMHKSSSGKLHGYPMEKSTVRDSFGILRSSSGKLYGDTMEESTVRGLCLNFGSSSGKLYGYRNKKHAVGRSPPGAA